MELEIKNKFNQLSLGKEILLADIPKILEEIQLLVEQEQLSISDATKLVISIYKIN